MKRNLLLAVAVSALPAAAMAQDITGGMTLSFTQQDVGGPDVDTIGLDGRMDIDWGNGFTFGLDAGHSTMSMSGTPIELGAEFVGIDGGYRFANGLKVGAYAERLTLGLNMLPIDLTAKSNGVTLGYEANGLDVEGFVGKSSLSIALPFDIEDMGVALRYTGKPGLEIGATFQRLEITDGVDSEHLDFAGVAGSYLVSDAIIVFGGFASTDVLGASVDTMGLGVGYDLGAKTGFSSTLSLELASTDIGAGDNMDTVRLGLSIPLGKKGPMIPINSVADSVLNGRHNALISTLTSAF